MSGLVAVVVSMSVKVRMGMHNAAMRVAMGVDKVGPQQ